MDFYGILHLRTELDMSHLFDPDVKGLAGHLFDPNVTSLDVDVSELLVKALEVEMKWSKTGVRSLETHSNNLVFKGNGSVDV